MTVINATNKDQTYISLDSVDSDDIINGGKGNDVFDGGGGDDTINSGAGDDIIDGGDGNDKLNAGAGDDILEGGNGDDVLNGGGGSDTFVFNFNLSNTASQTYTYDKVPLDYDAPTGGGRNVQPPDGLVSQPEFAQFMQDYITWLDQLVADGVIDDYTYSQAQADPLTIFSDPAAIDGLVSSVSWTQGNALQTRYWEQTITIPGELAITDSDGNDIVTQFQNAGPNVDIIELNGIRKDQALQLFTYETGDFDGDGVADDGRISWQGATDDADGSITFNNKTWADLNAFVNDAQVHFDV